MTSRYCDILKITPRIQEQIAHLFRTSQEWDDIFNILLVYVCVRRAYYAEHFDKVHKKLIKSVIKILNSSKLKPRMKIRNIEGQHIVYLDPDIDKIKSLEYHEDLGEILGFHCVGHDFGNAELHRLGLRISIERKDSKARVYAEYCVVDEKNAKKQYAAIEQFMQKKAEQYQKVGSLFGFTVSYQIRDEPGERDRIANLDDNRYLKKNFSDYANDVWNVFASTRFIDMDYDDVKKAGLLELFKFEHWTSTELKLYDELFPDRAGKTTEQLEILVRPIDEVFANFELDLMNQPELLKLPYKKWLDSPIFKQLVQIKYPKYVPLFYVKLRV
jgi:hypothetical protein